MISETEPFSNMSAGKDVDIKAFQDFLCHILTFLCTLYQSVEHFPVTAELKH